MYVRCLAMTSTMRAPWRSRGCVVDRRPTPRQRITYDAMLAQRACCACNSSRHDGSDERGRIAAVVAAARERDCGSHGKSVRDAHSCTFAFAAPSQPAPLPLYVRDAVCAGALPTMGAPAPPQATTTTATTATAAAATAQYKSFRDVVPLDEFRARYDALVQCGEQLSDVTVRVGGRVVSVRDMGRIVFLTLRGGSAGVELQVLRHVSGNCTAEELRRVKESVHVGDIVGATGVPGRTRRGELSLYAHTLDVVTPCTCTDLVVCASVTRRRTRTTAAATPVADVSGATMATTTTTTTTVDTTNAAKAKTAASDKRATLFVVDKDVRYRYRFVDLLTNPTLSRVVRQRHAIVKCLRAYLDARAFVEVETPVLHSVASGAHARPFVTHHNAADAELYLRVAPELYLKQCVVGGLERVYELGRVFRNEDADRSHNPEFTSCELYAAYHTCDDLMPLTEDLLRQLAMAANGHTRVTVVSCVSQTPVELDLARPFHRVHAYEAVARACGVELPPAAELDTPCGVAYLAALLLRHRVVLPSVRTAAKLFDCLLDHFVTSKVVEPTFVVGHPVCMSPLAREHDTQRGCAERFELFVNGVEYCNAYSELTDPQEQYRRFQRQLHDRHRGDDEAMSLDETFLKALQVGLPPTAGWGLGVDRVVALLCGCDSIRDALLFPLLRHDANSHDAKRRRRTAAFFGFSEHMTLFCLSALEAELVRRGAPAQACAHVRELRAYILRMQQQQQQQPPSPGRRTTVVGSRGSDDNRSPDDDGADEARVYHMHAADSAARQYDKWRDDAAAALVRFLCRTRN